MNLEGRIIRLRAVEPGDIDVMYDWENDTQIWGVSGTLAPFSRHTLERFIREQQLDIYQTRQQRLIIEQREQGIPLGTLDIFDLDPVNRRAGVGILIHDPAHRGQGYASEAVEVVCRYARDVLRLHQLWCNVGAENASSLALFRKAGFIEVGIKRQWQITPDGFCDEILLQCLLDTNPK